ncbi:hypothetical protein AAG906_019095 [Vitis piasezkii]
MILSWLLKSMEPEIGQTNMYLSTTKQLWDAMNETYSNLANSLQVYELKMKIENTTKGICFLWQELDLFYDLEWSCAEDNAQYQRTVENDCVNCECLARLAIPDKIPKCPLTQLSNSSSDYLTLKTKTLLRGRAWSGFQVCFEDEGEKLKVKVLVKWSRKDWLASVREKVWNVVEFGWSPPKVLDREGRPTNVIKLKLERDKGDNEASENNARVMYSIFNAISTDEFHRIATFTLVKEAWDILQVTHEDINAVKVSKLQMLTSWFETIRMEDHENFGEFHAKLMDIVNSSFNIGEPIPNSKVVRKILRSLLERFRAKVTSIEESKDVDSLKVDELVGSLQTFEMTLGSPRKSKGIALNAIKEESLGSEGEGDEKILDGEVARFARKFKKYMKFRKYKKSSKEDAKKWNNSMGKSNVKDKRKTRVSKRTLRLSASSVGERGTMPLNVLKEKEKKALQVTWSDTKEA